MTWTKFGAEFFDDCANHGLSDAAVRTHAEAIGWLYGVEQMDLTIRKHLVRRFAGSPDYEQAVRDLLAVEWWITKHDAYVIVHHADVIRASITAQQNQRARNKKAQGALRKRKGRDVLTAEVSDDVSDYADRQTDKQASTGTDVLQSDPQFWKTPSEMKAAGQCSVCQAALSSPLSIAEGVCAACDNESLAS